MSSIIVRLFFKCLKCNRRVYGKLTDDHWLEFDTDLDRCQCDTPMILELERDPASKTENL